MNSGGSISGREVRLKTMAETIYLTSSNVCMFSYILNVCIVQNLKFSRKMIPGLARNDSALTYCLADFLIPQVDTNYAGKNKTMLPAL